MEIPNIGVFRIRKGIAAVTFNEFLMQDTKDVIKKSVSERKEKGNMSLTKDTIKKFENYLDHEEKLDGKDQMLEIDDNTKNYLRKTFHIDVNSIFCQKKFDSYS